HADRVPGHESIEQVQGQVMGAEVERYPDRAMRELLRRVHRRGRGNHDGAVGDDRAAAELAALDPGLLHAAVVAPLARVVHVGLALLEEPPVTGERIQSVRAGDAGFGLPVLGAGVAVGEFDGEPLTLEEALVVRDYLGQTLERSRRFQHEPLHGAPPALFVDPRPWRAWYLTMVS